MKQRDKVLFTVALLVFVIAAILAYPIIFAKQQKAAEVSVEVITPITADFDKAALDMLADPLKVRDFYLPVDLSTGLGNPTPFNPF